MQLSLFDDLWAGALDNCKQLLLFFVWYLKFIERGFEVTDGGVEFGIGDVHVRMSGLDLLAVVIGGTSGGKGKELRKMFFELRDIRGGGFPKDGATAMERQTSLFNSCAGPI